MTTRATIRFDNADAAGEFLARPQDLTILSAPFRHIASVCVEVEFNGLTSMDEFSDRLFMVATIVPFYEAA